MPLLQVIVVVVKEEVVATNGVQEEVCLQKWGQWITFMLGTVGW
jgi:hypothetical protein